MQPTRWLVAMLVVVGLAGEAFAADGAGEAVHYSRLGLDIGVASAVGSIGLGYQIAPARIFRIEGGLGWGPTGTQFSLMPKVSLGEGTCHFVAGAGASLAVGNHAAAKGHGPNPDNVPWINLDALGIECSRGSGLSFQAAVGLTTPLVDFHYDVADLGDTVKAGERLPQGRMGVGWWF